MKIYRYWARGSAEVSGKRGTWSFSCFGGSDTNVEDARRRATETAQRVAQVLASGDPRGRYPYGERPLREEIVSEIRDQDRLLGVVTRNVYGALVVNAVESMFIDIDYQVESAGTTLKRLFGRLLGNKVPSRDEEIMTRVETVCATTPGLGLRLYRTAAGYRCLVTSGTFDPAATSTRDLLQRFGSDPLYVNLCRSQECFRARLTPKFWRCRGTAPPSRFPWPDQATEARYREWERSYERCSERYATCEYVGSYGSSAVDATVRTILDLHDQAACKPGLPLA